MMLIICGKFEISTGMVDESSSEDIILAAFSNLILILFVHQKSLNILTKSQVRAPTVRPKSPFWAIWPKNCSIKIKLA